MAMGKKHKKNPEKPAPSQAIENEAHPQDNFPPLSSEEIEDLKKAFPGAKNELKRVGAALRCIFFYATMKDHKTPFEITENEKDVYIQLDNQEQLFSLGYILQQKNIFPGEDNARFLLHQANDPWQIGTLNRNQYYNLLCHWNLLKLYEHPEQVPHDEELFAEENHGQFTCRPF